MWGISILADFRPMGISFHALIVFGLGKNLLFKSSLGRCVPKSFLNRGYNVLQFQLYLPRRLTTELFLMRNPIWSPTTFNLSESVN